MFRNPGSPCFWPGNVPGRLASPLSRVALFVGSGCRLTDTLMPLGQHVANLGQQLTADKGAKLFIEPVQERHAAPMGH